jgi:two-component system sensor histidine kinase MprB
VRDSGPGIPPDVDVFRLFETTKRDGSGLGLSIARQIAVRHGGSVRAGRADPEGGAAFWLELPGTSSAAGEPAQETLSSH